MENTNTHFPLFFNLKDKEILIVGAGNISKRRLSSLIHFGCKITVVTKENKYYEDFPVKIIFDTFKEEYVLGKFLVLAVTDNRNTNHEVYLAAKRNNIIVNVCDCKEECDFFFPALFENEAYIGGLISKNGSNHRKLKLFAEKIRTFIKNN